LKCSACSLSSKTNLRRERQLEGIAKAKAAGVYKGRPPTIDPSEVLRLKNEGPKIAKRLQIGRASVYRVVADAKGNTRLARTAPMVR
jgi:DNA invertase Pin-like site-specific DNA recombinase